VSYSIEFTPRSRSQLAKLSKSVQVKLAQRIAALADDPRPPGSRKIKGYSDCYRIRCGDYRVVYATIDRDLVVLVVCAGHRKEVYERLESVDRTVQRFKKGLD
jgi:mRNA interferase RelE/StbE